MRGQLKKIGIVCATAASFLPYCALQAQGRPAPADEAGAVGTSGAGDVEDIIVTARRKEERLIDVPVAITAMDSKQIARYASSSIEAVGTQIPQVFFTKNPSGNGANINIRGVGTNTSADDGIEQAVSVNIDEVPTARGRILQAGLFDIEGIQVLKGPQALYFGKNSPGGTVVIQSKGPTDHLEGYVRAGYEFAAHEYSAEGAIGGPVTDTLGVRIAARGSKMLLGYVHNIAQPISAANDPIAYDRTHGLAIPGAAFSWGPNSKQYAVRGTARWEPTSNFNATLKAFYSDYRDQGDASQNVIASCSPGATQAMTTDLSNVFVTGRPGVAADPNSYCGGDRRVNTIGELPAALLAGLPFNKGDSEFTHSRNYLSSLVLNYDADKVALTSVTGYYKYSNIGNSFFDSNSLSLAGGGANSYYHSINQEFRFVTKFDGPINITGGAFYGHDHRLYKTWSSIIRGLDPVTGFSVTSAGEQYTTGDTLSAFAEVTWKLAPSIELAAGARYTHEKKTGLLFNTYVSPQGAALNLASAVGRSITPSLTNNNLSPQATLTWHPTSDTTLYAAYRTGFKAGAITNPGLIAPTLNAVNAVLEPEKVKGYEAGVKFQTPDRRLSGDMAIYHYLYRNLQVSAFDSVANTVTTQNAGGSEVNGIEGNLNFRATHELTLRAAAGYNRGRYTTFTNAGPFGGQTVATGCTKQAAAAPFACVQQNLTGQPLPRAPEWSGTAGASWDAPLTGDLMLGINVDIRAVSKYNFVATNNPFAIQKAYSTIDSSIRLHDSADRWEFAIIGRNLANKFYYTVGSERPLGSNPGSIQGVPGLPRTVLAQATYNF